MPDNSLRFWLSLLQREAEKSKIMLYLVGGYLRNLLLGKSGNDVDIVGGQGTLATARELARAHSLPVQYVKRHRLLRLQAGGYRLDVGEAEDIDLCRNLLSRDFTINAMALPLQGFLWGSDKDFSRLVIDPAGGLDDVRRKCLRALPGSLQADPVRILRAARLAREYELRLEGSTLAEAGQAAPLLAEAAAERVTAEVLAALTGGVRGYLPLLSALGAVVPLFGRSAAYAGEHLADRLEWLLAPSALHQSTGDLLSEYLAGAVTVPHTRLQLLRLAALTAAVNAAGAPRFLKSAREKSACAEILAGMQALMVAKDGKTAGVLYDYYLRFPDYAVEGVLLWAAAVGPCGNHTAQFYLGTFLGGSRLVHPPLYLSGGEVAAVMGKKKIAPEGVKEARLQLRRAAALGGICSRRQASFYLEGYLNGKYLK